MGFKVVFRGKQFFNISDEQEGVVNVAAVYLCVSKYIKVSLASKKNVLKKHFFNEVV